MAFKYFKVPPHLAEIMQIANKAEKRLPDGNYMAVNSDMAMFYPPYVAIQKAESMGCLALSPVEMIQEFKGVISRPLPEPTDPRFFPPHKDESPVVEKPDNENEDIEFVEPLIDEEIEIVIEPQTEEEEPQPDMVFEDEDGNPLINVYIPDIEEEVPTEDEPTPNEEGGE